MFQNNALQSQVVQLQEDIKTDTKLRRELVDRLEQAKGDLNQELLKLDKSLKVTSPSPQLMTFPIEHFLLFLLIAMSCII